MKISALPPISPRGCRTLLGALPRGHDSAGCRRHTERPAARKTERVKGIFVMGRLLAEHPASVTKSKPPVLPGASRINISVLSELRLKKSRAKVFHLATTRR